MSFKTIYLVEDTDPESAVAVRGFYSKVRAEAFAAARAVRLRREAARRCPSFARLINVTVRPIKFTSGGLR